MKIDSSIAAVVTGGASGLGRASAEALASAGAKVAIFDINEAQGEEVAAKIGGIFCKVDITSEESVVAGFAKARAAHGQERVLVHCAMTSKRGKTLSESLAIMRGMCERRHLDGELFELFVASGVCRRYARKYLRPEQIDLPDGSEAAGDTTGDRVAPTTGWKRQTNAAP